MLFSGHFTPQVIQLEVHVVCRRDCRLLLNFRRQSGCHSGGLLRLVRDIARLPARQLAAHADGDSLLHRLQASLQLELDAVFQLGLAVGADLVRLGA